MTKSELAKAYLEKASKRRRVLEVLKTEQYSAEDANRATTDAIYALEAARRLIEDPA